MSNYLTLPQQRLSEDPLGALFSDASDSEGGAGVGPITVEFSPSSDTKSTTTTTSTPSLKKPRLETTKLNINKGSDDLTKIKSSEFFESFSAAATATLTGSCSRLSLSILPNGLVAAYLMRRFPKKIQSTKDLGLLVPCNPNPMAIDFDRDLDCKKLFQDCQREYYRMSSNENNFDFQNLLEFDDKCNSRNCDPPHENMRYEIAHCHEVLEEDGSYDPEATKTVLSLNPLVRSIFALLSHIDDTDSPCPNVTVQQVQLFQLYTIGRLCQHLNLIDLPCTTLATLSGLHSILKEIFLLLSESSESNIKLDNGADSVIGFNDNDKFVHIKATDDDFLRGANTLEIDLDTPIEELEAQLVYYK